jgi:hypothetical protein
MIRPALLVLLLVASQATASDPTDRPVQVQLGLAGWVLDHTINSLADETVDDVAVNSWKPGIGVGYHYNRYLYFGYSLFPSLDLTLRERWGFTNAGSDGSIVLDHETGTIHSLEARLTPVRHGPYVSLAFVHARPTRYDMEFRRLGETMLIGANSYATDLNVKWKSEALTRLGLGLGYNLALENGVSVNIGLVVPLDFPDDDNIEFTQVNDDGTPIDPDDLRRARCSWRTRPSTHPWPC